MVRVSIKNERRMKYRTMIVLAVLAGGLGIALQLLPDGENLSFMLSVAVLGSLIGGSHAYTAREREQLRQSYQTAYEWLLLAIMFAYAFILLSRWWSMMEGAVLFLNGHWPGLLLATMCLFMGMAGFRRTSSESPT